MAKAVDGLVYDFTITLIFLQYDLGKIDAESYIYSDVKYIKTFTIALPLIDYLPSRCQALFLNKRLNLYF